MPIKEFSASLMNCDDKEKAMAPTTAGAPPPSFGGAQGAAARLAQELQHKRYQLARDIGHGGVGRVTEVREEVLRRSVAMKLLLPLDPAASGAADDLASRQNAEARLIREARITGILEHPSIVPIHDLGQDEGGEIFYTMKKVQGWNLREVIRALAGDAVGATPEAKAEIEEIRRRWIRLSDRLEVMEKVCDALSFAHSHELRVIHRDLKPDNIMVGTFGEVLVMDWGLAKVLGKGETAKELRGSDQFENGVLTKPLGGVLGLSPGMAVSAAGEFMGTMEYAPPEQLEGDHDAIDERTDVYALGGLLYHLLTLKSPLAYPSGTLPSAVSTEQQEAAPISIQPARATTASLRECLLAHISGKQTVPAARESAKNEKTDDVPEPLRAVIRRAMEPDKSRRIQTAAEFKSALRKFQEGYANPFEEAGLWRHFTYFVKRHRAVSITAAASVVLIAGLTFNFTRGLTKERNRAEDQGARAQKEALNAKNAQAAAENLLHEKEREKARADQQTAHALSALQKARAAHITTHWNAAIEAFSAKKPAKAVAHLCEVLRNDPDHLLASRMLVGILSNTSFPRLRFPPWHLEESLAGIHRTYMVKMVARDFDGFWPVNPAGLAQEIKSIDLSDDGSRALMTGYLQDARLMNTYDGKTLWSVLADPGDTDTLTGFGLSHDGQHVLQVSVAKSAKADRITGSLAAVVRVIDGQVLSDTTERQEDIDAIVNATLLEHIHDSGHRAESSELLRIARLHRPVHIYPAAPEVIRSAGKIEISTPEHRVIIPTLKPVHASWLSPDRHWLCLNDGDYSGVHLHALEPRAEVVWKDADSVAHRATFDAHSEITAIEYSEFGGSGDTRAALLRLNLWGDWRRESAGSELELPLAKQSHRAVICKDGTVLGVAGKDGSAGFFTLRPAPWQETPTPAQTGIIVRGSDPDDVDLKLLQMILKDKVADFFASHDGYFASDENHETALLFGNGSIEYWTKTAGRIIGHWEYPPDATVAGPTAGVVLPGNRVCITFANLLAIFDLEHSNVVSQRILDLARGRPIFLHQTNQLVIADDDGFSVFDPVTLTETTHCRPGRYSYVGSWIAAAPPAGDLRPSRALLQAAEQLAGWRIDELGEFRVAAVPEDPGSQASALDPVPPPELEREMGPRTELEKQFLSWLKMGVYHGSANPMLSAPGR